VVCTVYQQEQVAVLAIDDKVHDNDAPSRQGDRRRREEIGGIRSHWVEGIELGKNLRSFGG
jgi:hypothetical protein